MSKFASFIGLVSLIGLVMLAGCLEPYSELIPYKVTITAPDGKVVTSMVTDSLNKKLFTRISDELLILSDSNGRIFADPYKDQIIYAGKDKDGKPEGVKVLWDKKEHKLILGERTPWSGKVPEDVPSEQAPK